MTAWLGWYSKCSEKWLDLGYILKIEWKGLADGVVKA